MAAIIKRGKIYYLRLQHGGRETWISTHRTSERDARKVADRIESEFQRERQTRQLANAILALAKQLAEKQLLLEDAATHIAAVEKMAVARALAVIDTMLPAQALTAADLWAKYLQSEPGLKPSTMVTKEQRVGKFIAWAGERDMRDMPETACRAFLRSLGAIKGQTHNNYIAELSSVWKAMPDIKNPWGEHLRAKGDSEHKKPFTIEQVRSLLQYCADTGETFWHAAVMISYYTGLRLKDVVMLERQQVADGHIDLIPAKTESSKKRVRIPVNPELAAELAAIPLDSLKYFFPKQAAKYNSARTRIPDDFRKLLIRAGLSGSGYGFHSLRHTFVTEALNAGISMKDVQAVVGHTAIEVTEGTYYHGEKKADLTAYPSLKSPP